VFSYYLFSIDKFIGDIATSIITSLPRNLPYLTLSAIIYYIH